MKNTVFTPLCAFIFLATLPYPAISENPTPQKWQGYIEFEGKISADRDLGEAGIFVPLYQNDNSMIFTDIRARIDNNSSSEGNFGLGFRKLTQNDIIFGGYAFYDRRRTSNANVFHQATLGAEVLTENIEGRINVYIPEGGSQDTGAATTRTNLSGGNIQFQNLGAPQERALPGFDAEFGYGWNLDANWDVWAYGGGYYFDASGYDEVAGPRGRIELTRHNLPFLGQNSKFTLGAEAQTDDVRGDQIFGLARLRIPFNSFNNTAPPSSNLSDLEKRMVSRIYRDVDIVAGQKDAEVVSSEAATVTLSSGVDVTSYTIIDAAGELDDDVAAAGANALIVVDGSKGDIVSPDTAYFSTGQTLIGGGSVLSATGVNSGTTLAIALPGVRPTIIGSGPNTLVGSTTNDITIQNLSITGSVNAIVFSGTSSNAIIKNVSLNNTNSGIQFIQNSSGNIENVQINAASGAFGGIAATDNAVVSANNIEVTDSNIGVYVNSANLTLNNSVITGSTNSAIYTDDFFGGTPSLAVNNTIINNTTGDGIQAENSALSGSGNEITGFVGGTVCNDAGGNAGSIAFNDILGGGPGTCP